MNLVDRSLYQGAVLLLLGDHRLCQERDTELLLKSVSMYDSEALRTHEPIKVTLEATAHGKA